MHCNVVRCNRHQPYLERCFGTTKCSYESWFAGIYDGSVLLLDEQCTPRIPFKKISLLQKLVLVSPAVSVCEY